MTERTRKIGVHIAVSLSVVITLIVCIVALAFLIQLLFPEFHLTFKRYILIAAISLGGVDLARFLSNYYSRHGSK